MLIKVEKSAKIPNGNYQGKIVNVRYRNKIFQYIDLEIEFTHQKETRTLRAGYPQLITESSKLGRLLSRFGQEIVVDEEIDPDKSLLNNDCLFDIYTEKNEKGSFSRINTDSVRPNREQKEIMEK